MTTKWSETRSRCVCGHLLGEHSWRRDFCNGDRESRDVRPACPCSGFLADKTFAELLDRPAPVAPDGVSFAEMMAWPEMAALADAMTIPHASPLDGIGFRWADRVHIDDDDRTIYVPAPTDRCLCGHDAYGHRDNGVGECRACTRDENSSFDYCGRFRLEIQHVPDDEPYMGMTNAEFDRQAVADEARFGPGRDPEPSPLASREETAAMAARDALGYVETLMFARHYGVWSVNGRGETEDSLLIGARAHLRTAVANLPDVTERLPK